ncbi:MAG TPA: hypothetical protein PLG52_10630 [Anaerolineales bacterium]|nr:hypothetical protein [Anaerolineales bacterium]HNE06554.1 hypothetical protein [Anaerolineales bacterium]
MAKVKLNPALQQIRGRLAGFVYRIRYGEQTISKSPDMSKVKWSAAQVEHRRRFKLAVAYAHLAMGDEKVRLQYMAEAAEKGKRPFDLAVSDYFKGRNLLMKSESSK